MSTVSVYVEVIRGTAKTFTATFTDLPAPYGTGLLIDADSHSISFYDGNGLLQATATNPNHISLGTYDYTYTIPATAAITPPGNKWRIVWKMTKGGLTSGGDNFFIVTA